MRELKSGYTFDPSLGAVYHFERVTPSQAEALLENKEAPCVVETVNTSIADDGSQHLNKYYALGLRDAVMLAGRIEAFSADTGEEVVGIRGATAEEAERLEKVWSHYIRGYDPRAMGEDLEIV